MKPLFKEHWPYRLTMVIRENIAQRSFAKESNDEQNSKLLRMRASSERRWRWTTETTLWRHRGRSVYALLSGRAQWKAQTRTQRYLHRQRAHMVYKTERDIVPDQNILGGIRMTRRRILYTDRNTKRTYSTPEFNGDKTELGQRGSRENCDCDWPVILALFDNVESLDDFCVASEKAQRTYHFIRFWIDRPPSLCFPWRNS